MDLVWWQVTTLGVDHWVASLNGHNHLQQQQKLDFKNSIDSYNQVLWSRQSKIILKKQDQGKFPIRLQNTFDCTTNLPAHCGVSERPTEEGCGLTTTVSHLKWCMKLKNSQGEKPLMFKILKGFNPDLSNKRLLQFVTCLSISLYIYGV